MLGALLAAACQGPTMVTLVPGENPMPATDPLWSAQPHRDRPRDVCVSSELKKAWVMLGGVEDAPGEEVAVVDLAPERVLRRVKLGRSPWDCALHPSGKYLVVLLRYSNQAVVLDARTDAELSRVEVPFYTEVAAFTPDGQRLYLANRWKDSVLWWDLSPGPSFRLVSKSYDGVPWEDPMGVPAPTNPTSMAVSPDGRFLFVGAASGVATAVLDARSGVPVDVDQDPSTTSLGAPRGISWIAFNSPVGGLAVSERHLFIADVGPGTGSLAAEGLDLDGDGLPGDGTGNVVFQDLQNEIAVVSLATLRQVHRYTSDTLCCRDFRDVDPDKPDRGLLLPSPDTWPPEAVRHLPAKDTWVVAGALPEAMVVHGGQLYVAFAGSNEVQGFAVGDDGSLVPLQRAGGLFRTGYNPKALAADGERLIAVNRLGESLSFIDLAAGPGGERTLVVGDESEGAFPRTDAELGEAVNEMTAAFTIDGDQTCVHCHRDNGAIARPIVMPLQELREWGARNIMAQRGLFDTRPWFLESAMDEVNFFPVINEFARKENFCCEQLDPTVWARYPSAAECAQSPSRPGCAHVLDCRRNPPPECAQRPYAPTPHLSRAAFFRDGARELLGRDETFGDALYTTAGDGSRRPVPLDFNGVTRALGLFMLRTPRLLPNPNRWLDLPSARRGEELYSDSGVGCGRCHPLPTTTTAVDFAPGGMPIRFPPVVTPSLDPRGQDASRVSRGFLDTFPATVQTPAGLHLGATPLRGLWDRPETRLLHDGRARSLREVLATPGHAVLRPGEVGRNERHGVFDLHGGTSHLDRYQVEDLLNFLKSL